MATPTIKIDQPTPGPGVAGDSREDLITGEVVTLTDPANGVGPSYLWTMVARPQGSSAALAGATTDTATFTPDVEGDYLIKLVVDGTDNSGVDDTLAGEAVFISSQGGCRVKLPGALAGLGAIPSAGESKQFDANGVARDFDPYLRQISLQLPTSAEKAGLPNLPTAGEKADLGVLNGAADGVLWYAAGGVVAALPAGLAGQILQSGGAGAPSWVKKAIPVIAQVTATGTTTVGVGSPALISGMTITPGVAGDYLVIFTSSADMGTNNALMNMQVNVGGAVVTHTTRSFRRGAGQGDVQCHLVVVAYLPGVAAPDAIEILGNTTAGLASIDQRTMIVARAEI